MRQMRTLAVAAILLCAAAVPAATASLASAGAPTCRQASGSCNTCLLYPGCGYCQSSQTCDPGSASGPEYGSCAVWSFYTCTTKAPTPATPAPSTAPPFTFTVPPETAGPTPVPETPANTPPPTPPPKPPTGTTWWEVPTGGSVGRSNYAAYTLDVDAPTPGQRWATSQVSGGYVAPIVYNGILCAPAPLAGSWGVECVDELTGNVTQSMVFPYAFHGYVPVASVLDGQLVLSYGSPVALYTFDASSRRWDLAWNVSSPFPGPFGGTVYGPVTVPGSGAIFTQWDQLVATNATDGSELWTGPYVGMPTAAVTVAASAGLVLSPSAAGALTAFNLTGGAVWTYNNAVANAVGVTTMLSANVALATFTLPNGYSQPLEYVALDVATGAAMWSLNCSQGQTSSSNTASAASDGTHVFVVCSGALQQLDAATGNPEWAPLCPSCSNPPLALKSHVAVASNNCVRWFRRGAALVPAGKTCLDSYISGMAFHGGWLFVTTGDNTIALQLD
mmetsp:Transcript_30256/g.93347  ORF Transcript_30256/g.93347 Transcript_30256/m.93347 type:complete len:504 (-) Transcript_30256:116-1627(-)